ncbi:hypothetical protein JTE90_006107 [Oedothorax gibbosus]|uniref:Uncharacterized protein n=1 Tax=Oedothorax gibbosus TaxID=931172 RepID=A0AAV6V5K9_9ARAC|nr:hypothetical protein JTE90_006107 [Oedothorax gibbosus]
MGTHARLGRSDAPHSTQGKSVCHLNWMDVVNPKSDALRIRTLYRKVANHFQQDVGLLNYHCIKSLSSLRVDQEMVPTIERETFQRGTRNGQQTLVHAHAFPN